MKIDVQIDSEVLETKVVIHAHEYNDEVLKIINKLESNDTIGVVGYQEDRFQCIPFEDIVRIYGENKKVILETEFEKYVVRQRIFELEEILPNQFVRISNSEIVNLHQVEVFDCSVRGVISVRFKNQKVSYISRRYISKLKSILEKRGV